MAKIFYAIRIRGASLARRAGADLPAFVGASRFVALAEAELGVLVAICSDARVIHAFVVYAELIGRTVDSERGTALVHADSLAALLPRFAFHTLARIDTYVINAYPSFRASLAAAIAHGR